MPGSSERSYGVYAAKLAGLPRPVVRRAEKLLTHYEAEANEGKDTSDFVQQAGERRLRNTTETKIAETLLEADLDSLSPVEALMKLYELRRLAEEERKQAHGSSVAHKFNA